MTTATSDNANVHTEHDLFSHPYTYQWHGKSDPLTGHRVSRENRFSEPTDPNRPAHRLVVGVPTAVRVGDVDAGGGGDLGDGGKPGRRRVVGGHSSCQPG